MKESISESKHIISQHITLGPGEFLPGQAYHSDICPTQSTVLGFTPGLYTCHSGFIHVTSVSAETEPMICSSRSVPPDLSGQTPLPSLPCAGYLCQISLLDRRAAPLILPTSFMLHLRALTASLWRL